MPVDGRMKQNVDILVFQQFAVAREVARIGGEIFARAELRRIDEDRHHHAIAALSRCPHQTKMSLVQKPHRRHEGDTPILSALGLAPAAHSGNGFNDLHEDQTGDLEYRSDGVLGRPITPLLHHSILISERMFLGREIFVPSLRR